MGFYDQVHETLDRERLAELQSAKLVRLMAVLREVPFYRRKLEAAGLAAGEIRGLADLGKLPFTHKSELLEAQERVPPYGDLLSAPSSEYRYLHRTSGTSGRPLYWLDTEEDWQTWLRCWRHVYAGAGVAGEDVVFCAFSFGPYVAHWSALAAARSLGALAIPGAAMTTRERLAALRDHRATVVVATPTYALHLAQVARQLGIDLPSSAVRITIHAGEPGASVPNVKERIEGAWGARAYDHAGATEVGAWSFPCQADRLSLHLNELEFVFEVVDRTGAPVATGERGELVVTTLSRLGMPVVRYRTGDLVVRTEERCDCGRTLTRVVGGVIGRADDMVVVRGVNVYPSAIDDLVWSVREVEEYQVEIRRRGELDELRLAVEVAPGAAFDLVAERLTELFRSRLGIRVPVAHAASGSLPRYELKARRYRRVDG